VVPFIALISSMSFFENISAIHEASVDCFEELLFGKKSPMRILVKKYLDVNK